MGGRVDPDWEGGARPRWFPAEFGWVVGCSYTGQPERLGTVLDRAARALTPGGVLLVVGHDDVLLGVLTRIDMMEYLEHSDEEHRLY